MVTFEFIELAVIFEFTELAVIFEFTEFAVIFDDLNRAVQARVVRFLELSTSARSGESSEASVRVAVSIGQEKLQSSSCFFKTSLVVLL